MWDKLLSGNYGPRSPAATRSTETAAPTVPAVTPVSSGTEPPVVPTAPASTEIPAPQA